MMRRIDDIGDMREWSETQRREGRRIALVPTMGYLHEGHLNLVREGRRRGDRLVVSIFVNPAQFGSGEDFAAYPRDWERDHRLLKDEDVDVVFHPATEAMYPRDYQTHVEVEKLSAVLCGIYRPGHFHGVATVVVKLFNIVRPHVAIFGAKDYQQLQLLRRLVRDLNYDVEIVGHPIVREADGLAISSRNVYLNSAERRAALSLSRAITKAEAMVRRGEKKSQPILAMVRAEIEKEPLALLEYASLCDPVSLEAVERIGEGALLALAVRIGRARLIDNGLLRP